MSDVWRNLTKRARRVRDERPDAMPYGFDTRVLALVREARAEHAEDMIVLGLWRRFVCVGSVLLIAVAVVNYGVLVDPHDLLDPAHAVAVLSYLE